MKQIAVFSALVLSAVVSVTLAADNKVAPAPNGIQLPEGFKDWRVIAPSYRTDKKHIRVIVGNDAAIKAVREGKTNPWPDGAVLGKLVWKEKADANWAPAIVPAEFVHAEFMVKDASKYAASGGWGYARWTGLELKPYGKDAEFAQECVACHTPVKSNDFVFTHPAVLP